MFPPGVLAAIEMEETRKEDIRCVLLAERHHGLTEAVRGLLSTVFDVVVMVADEISMIESAGRLQNLVVVVDFSLAQGDGVGLVRRLRDRFPQLPLVVISVHDESNVSQLALRVGANAFVLKSRIATDLLAAVDAVLLGQRYVSPEITGTKTAPVGGEEGQ
jgi:DNA-binding NarL/FixJ family response regulator